MEYLPIIVESAYESMGVNDQPTTSKYTSSGRKRLRE